MGGGHILTQVFLGGMTVKPCLTFQTCGQWMNAPCRKVCENSLLS